MIQKLTSYVVVVLVVGTLASAGFALLAVPITPEPVWFPVAHVDQLPQNGDPVRAPILVQERDAWTIKPERCLGHVFLRRTENADKVVAIPANTRYGAKLEWDGATRAFHDRRCWGFEFDLNGVCAQDSPRHDLPQADVKVENGRVFVKVPVAEWEN